MVADVVNGYTCVGIDERGLSSDVLERIQYEKQCLEKALISEDYSSKIVQNLMQCRNFKKLPENEDDEAYKIALNALFRQQAQELAKLERNIVKYLYSDDIPINSKLGKANQNVIYDTLNCFKNEGKYCFWFGSPEDREATLNEWKEKMGGYSMTIVELSLKDVVKKNKTDVVSTCEKMLRENLIEMLKENSTKELDEYQYCSVDEIVKNGYGIGKPNPQNPLLSGCKLGTAIVIKDLEELSLTETEQFLQMYEKWLDHAQDTFFIVCGDQSAGGEMFKIQKKYPYVMENSMGL